MIAMTVKMHLRYAAAVRWNNITRGPVPQEAANHKAITGAEIFRRTATDLNNYSVFFNIRADENSSALAFSGKSFSLHINTVDYKPLQTQQ
jgi:hypothetical protein